MSHHGADTAALGHSAHKSTMDIGCMLARTVRPALLALAICGSYSASAFADECPGNRIAGAEYHNLWRVRIDLAAGTVEGTSKDGRHLTADIDVTCDGSKVTMRESNKTDGNDCTYILNRRGRYVEGNATCTRNTGVTDFHGMFE
jgi:hypothetical protein